VSAARRVLLSRCLEAALEAVDGRRIVPGALAGIDLPPGTPIIALGKAAAAMLAGAVAALGDRAGPALCITRADSIRPAECAAGIRVIAGDHPVPGARSLAAGRELLAFIDGLPLGMPVLCLLSGGSSALVEALPAGMELADLEQANRWLLASGLPIDAVNQVRARLSCLKAGRLARRLTGRRVVALAISDVPGDDPAVIGSGPWTAALPSPLPRALPGWLRELLALAPPQPAPGDPALAEVDYRVIGNGARALAAAGAVARAAGVPVQVHDDPLQGEVPDAARQLLASLAAGPPGFHAWSGETTVRLPEHPGRGGRNSHLALTLACALAGRDGIDILCAATDGSDGTGGAAGGWADGGVIARGTALGLDARQALAGADSGAFLAMTGDAWHSGPTGTNVMDLVLAVLAPRDRGV
jgi:glycerate 2-kinase